MHDLGRVRGGKKSTFGPDLQEQDGRKAVGLAECKEEIYTNPPSKLLPRFSGCQIKFTTPKSALPFADFGDLVSDCGEELRFRLNFSLDG
jgi:hypothetical protein